MTNGIVASATPLPPQHSEFFQAERLQEALSYRAESTDVSYTDADGRSFNLSLRTESLSYAMTYDRAAQVRGGGKVEEGDDHHGRDHKLARGGRRGIRAELKALKKEFREITEALEDAGFEVKAFKKQLHRMLKAVDHAYRDHFRHRDPVEEEFAAVEQVHVEAAVAAQQVTVAMDDVDPEYWSAENTAQRLFEFATSRYQGGDRGDHVDQMVEGMKRGYAEAARAFGGELPEVAEDTIELAVEMLEEWAEGQPLDLVA